MRGYPGNRIHACWRGAIFTWIGTYIAECSPSNHLKCSLEPFIFSTLSLSLQPNKGQSSRAPNTVIHLCPPTTTHLQRALLISHHGFAHDNPAHLRTPKYRVSKPRDSQPRDNSLPSNPPSPRAPCCRSTFTVSQGRGRKANSAY